VFIGLFKATYGNKHQTSKVDSLVALDI